MVKIYLDIGANIGMWALKNVDNCDKIISIEASPKTFDRLRMTCNHPKIEVLQYAVCNNDNKDIKFYDSSCDVLSTISKDWLTSEDSRFYKYTDYTEIMCKSITIDRLIEEYGVPDLIKIDVEGAEYECIKSLTKKVNNLCFEWASELNSMTFKCMEYLESLGFNEFYVQFEDTYTFRPDRYYSFDIAKDILLNTTPKREWGMIWCR